MPKRRKNPRTSTPAPVVNWEVGYPTGIIYLIVALGILLGTIVFILLR